MGDTANGIGTDLGSAVYANDRRVRVLVVGPVSEGGGLARVARMSADGFDPRRFDIAVCDTARDTAPGRSSLAACRSHVRRLGRLLGGLRRHRPDVVHLHTCSYGTFERTLLDAVVCTAFRRPYVLHIHGGLFAEYLGSLRGVRRAAVFGVLRRASRLIVLGESWRTSLTRLVAGLRITVIPNAVEVRPDGDGFAGEASDVRGGGVLFVGDLSETKRPEDLLVAFAALPRALRSRYPLSLIGDGEPARRLHLEKLAERLGVAAQVRFTGALSHRVVCECLAAADLFVLSSRAEGLPLALLEAMAAGTPAVATRVGAVSEVARAGEEALLVPPGDPLALVAAMKQLLEDPPARRAMASAARARVTRDFSPLAFRRALADVWEKASPVRRREPVELPRLATSTFRSIP